MLAQLQNARKKLVSYIYIYLFYYLIIFLFNQKAVNVNPQTKVKELIEKEDVDELKKYLQTLNHEVLSNLVYKKNIEGIKNCFILLNK